MMERTLSKRRILELYLNVAEWGEGVFGAEAAARYHFGVPAAALTPRAGGWLAAILPSPRRYERGRETPYIAGRMRPSRRAWRRRRFRDDPDRLEAKPAANRASRELEDLQDNLREVQKHAWSRSWRTQHLAELRARLDRLHPADIAAILEALPLDERRVVWDLVKADRDGEILLEVSDAVRESLIEAMDSRELVAAAETLEADELADIAPDLPPSVIEEVVQSLPAEERERLRAALSYPGRRGRRADGLRPRRGARGRDARGGDALPAPARRAARPHRPAVRGRPRRRR